MKKLLSVFLTAAFLCGCLFGCAESENASGVSPSNTPSHTSAAELMESNSLTVYRDPMLGDILDCAVEAFQKEYPQVQVEYRSFGDPDRSENFSNYVSILQSELAAGKGPDVVVTNLSSAFSDIFKTLETGVFLDLDGLLQNDEEIDPEDYIPGSLEVGRFHGERCIVPVTYQTRCLISSKSRLNRAGIDVEGLASLPEFQKKVFSDMEEGSFLWDMQGYASTAVLPWCGVSPIDYESRTVSLDENFRQAMDFYKALYHEDYEMFRAEEFISDGDPMQDMQNLLGTDKLLFHVGFGIGDLIEYRMAEEEDRLLLSYPSVSGKQIAVPQVFGAIRSSSENSENAYRFLKIMLSSKVQQKCYGSSILLSALDSYLQEICMKGDYLLHNETVTRPISQEQMESALSFFTEGLEWRMPVSDSVQNMVWEVMEPYFRGDNGYESCVRQLEDRLVFYFDEG